jgi:hypothetical protein
LSRCRGVFDLVGSDLDLLGGGGKTSHHRDRQTQQHQGHQDFHDADSLSEFVAHRECQLPRQEYFNSLKLTPSSKTIASPMSG